jgi:hypothetical protein
MDFDSFPSYEELYELLESMVVKNRDLAWFETIGLSLEGRKIRAINVSNKDIPIENKEIVLIVCGRHGDEIGTRVVGLFLLEWLLSGEANHILKYQHIIIVPIANPDACVKGIFGLPKDKLSAMEKDTILKLSHRYIPDTVIDVHSVGQEKHGYNWGGLQAVVIDRNAKEGEDQYILNLIACNMIQKACENGHHFILHDVEFYRGLASQPKAVAEQAFNNHMNRACYESFHSLIFGVEVNHFIYSPNDTGRSGTEVIKSLLDMGNTIFPWEFYQGYPNRLLSGDFLASIRPKGILAGDRRKSRQEIWNNISGFIKPFTPYREMPNKHTVKVICKYSGAAKIKRGITLCFCLMNKSKIKRVWLNGEPAKHQIKEDPCCLTIFVDVENIQENDEKEIVAEF